MLDSEVRSSLSPRTVKYWYQDGLAVKTNYITVPASPCPTVDSSFLFSFPKSGSVLANKMLEDIMKEINVPVISISSILFAEAVSTNSVIFDFNSLFNSHGYCYAGFRRLPASMRGTLHQLAGKKLLLVRDPRDMLVSVYFSTKYSHWYPKAGSAQFLYEVELEKAILGETLDRGCINISSVYNSMFFDYKELLRDGAAKIIRYEDYIYDKYAFCKVISDTLGAELPEDVIKSIASKYAEMPENEKPNEHIRQVHPGDHKRKLKQQTIDVLDSILSEFIAEFGY